MNQMTIDNGQLFMEIDGVNGAIVKFGDRKRGIQLVEENRLAENFRLLVPLDDWRGHFIFGRDQKLSTINKIGLNKWELTWDNLVSQRGTFDIQVKLMIELENEKVIFNTAVTNRSGFVVEEVLSPAIGGLRNFEEENDWVLHYVQGNGKGEEFELYKNFPGSYLGPKFPVWMKNYECMPWIDLYHKKNRKGVYIGNHDREARFSMFYAQLMPGVSQRDKSWPRPEELISGTPIGLMIGSLSFPFLQDGGTYLGPQIVVNFHDGIWYSAADIYRNWYDSCFPNPKQTTWLSDADAWQSTIISWPEDTVNYRFSDLPRLAKEALSCGIYVLQIDGWDIGGIDRSYPHYTPDPRLGTWNELKDAIAECRKIGVRILLFANLQWANIETDWFRNELHNYSVKDPRGYWKKSMGWEYHTALGLNLDCESRMVIMNPRHTKFQEIILDQLENIVKLGADGVQLDKMFSGAFSHFGACIDYHREFADERDSSIMQGILDTVEKFLVKAREVNPEFCIASESHWDRLVTFVNASYARFFEEKHIPTFTYTFPEFRQTDCISGPADFGMVNNSIMYGHIVNIEANCIHGSAADVPDLAPYVAESLKIRRNLKDVLWNSRLVEPTMVEVKGNEIVKYAVHQSKYEPKKYALVLTNNSRQPNEIELFIDEASEVTISQPFSETIKGNLPKTVQIPAMRFIVINWEK